MSDTPRTDAALVKASRASMSSGFITLENLARELESENARLREAIIRAERRVAELETPAVTSREWKHLAQAWQERAERNKRDAARYRWLRDAAFDGNFQIRRISDNRMLSHMQLDAAIDKATKGAK